MWACVDNHNGDQWKTFAKREENQSSTNQLDAIKAAAIAQAYKNKLDAEEKERSMNPYAAQEQKSNCMITTMLQCMQVVQWNELMSNVAVNIPAQLFNHASQRNDSGK